MLERTEIQKIVFTAIDRLNELLLDEEALCKDENTVLLGTGSKLDSMGFVNFVVALEEAYIQVTGVDGRLIDRLHSGDIEAERVCTVRELIEFLHRLPPV